MKFNNKIFVFLGLSTIMVSNAFAYRIVGAEEANPGLLKVHSNSDFRYKPRRSRTMKPVKKEKKKKNDMYKKLILKEKLKKIIKEMDFKQKLKFLEEQKKVQEKFTIEDIKFKTKLLEYKIQLLNSRLEKLAEIPYNDLKNELYIYTNDPTVIVKKVDYNKIVQGQNDKLLLRYLLAKDLGLVNEGVSTNLDITNILNGKGGSQMRVPVGR